MDFNMINNIKAPKLDQLIFIASNEKYALDNKTKELVYSLFNLMYAIAACNEDEYRELWLVAERGNIEDFGRYEEYLECGEVDNWEEFIELWHDYYPDEVKWYKLVTIIHSNDKYRTIFLDGKQIIEIDERCLEQTTDCTIDYAGDHLELITWIMYAVDNCINALKDRRYNNYVSENLPYKKRVGKILRKDYWCIFP